MNPEPIKIADYIAHTNRTQNQLEKKGRNIIQRWFDYFRKEKRWKGQSTTVWSK